MTHGLIASPQRFNVAITRAKALLVIVGDPNALWEVTVPPPSYRPFLVLKLLLNSPLSPRLSGRAFC